MAVKTLLVLRHAKSSWKTGASDLQRPLSERGLRDAQVAGALLAEYPIDLTWCSSAKRARQTWDEAQAGGATASRTEVSEAVYYAWADELIAEINALDESVATLLIVGHQPTVGDLVTTLAKPSDLAEQAAEHYPTAGIAVLTYRGGWKTLGPDKAVLTRFEKPRAEPEHAG